MKTKEMLRDKKGQSAAFAAVIPLVLVFGTAIVIAVLMSTIGANVYTSTASSMGVGADDTNAETTAKTVSQVKISDDINTSNENAFEAFNQATSNLDLLAIIAVASAVLMGIGGFFFASRGSMGSGGAL